MGSVTYSTVAWLQKSIKTCILQLFIACLSSFSLYVPAVWPISPHEMQKRAVCVMHLRMSSPTNTVKYYLNNTLLFCKVKGNF